MLSFKNNATLIGILFTISSIVFAFGYYFGTEKTNKELFRTENELIKLKDSLSSTRSFDNTKVLTNKEEKIIKSVDNSN